MIPRSAITHWNKQVPWEDIANVEQDLIITRALTDIFSDEFLASELAFRGGTALHKLYLAPQPRYSEDIDLVQINPGPIKPILFRLGEVLNYLPDKVIKPKRFNNTMLFRMSGHGKCNRSSRGQASTACRCLRRWCGWRPGRHCACPAAGTRCSHVRCGPGVVFFRREQGGVEVSVLEMFDYCSCDFTCVFVLPEEKENHFPMQQDLNFPR